MIKVVGTGSYLPEKVLTNFDLEKMVETSNDWIVQRTGIEERRIAADNESTSDLGVKAARKALEMADMKPEDIEMIIVATSTPDYLLPACAPIIQDKLGCGNIPAFDVNSVCTGFSYAFINAVAMVQSGFYKNCLIIGAEVYSKIINWEDRNTCIIFGDGAGATIIKHDDSKKGILSQIYGADGAGAELIKIHAGGSKNSLQDISEYSKADLLFQMNGKKVYEFTISVIPKITRRLLDEAGLDSDSIDWIILHQANNRIIESISKKLKIDINKFVVTIKNTGNTSSASIPIAMDWAVRDKRIKSGDKVMILGFGGGLSWGGSIFEW